MNISQRGCVSGFQLCNVRDAVQEEEGKFNWDLLDGYDELRLVLMLFII